MPTFGGVDYEVFDPPEFSFGRDGKATGTEKLVISWSDIDNFVTAAFPEPTIVNGEVNFSNTRRFPGRTYLVADKIRVASHFPGGSPVVKSDGTVDYALLTIDYKTTDRDEDQGDDGDSDDPQKFMTHSISLGGQFLNMPSSGLKWDGEVDPIKADNINAGKIIPTIEHQFDWEFVPNPPFASIRTSIGRVNSGSFVGASSESLLFLGAEASREITYQGAKLWRISYRFSERLLEGNKGWNYFYREDTGSWELLRQLNGDTIYEATDFSSIFQF